MTALTHTQLQRKCLEMRGGGGAKRGCRGSAACAGQNSLKSPTSQWGAEHNIRTIP